MVINKGYSQTTSVAAIALFAFACNSNNSSVGLSDSGGAGIYSTTTQPAVGSGGVTTSAQSGRGGSTTGQSGISGSTTGQSGMSGSTTNVSGGSVSFGGNSAGSAGYTNTGNAGTPENSAGKAGMVNGGSAAGMGGGSGTAGTGGVAGNPPATCTGQGLTPGNHDVNISFNSLNRSYILHVPTGYNHTQAIALVLNIHAYSSDATYQMNSSNMNATADANGFAVAYPNSDSGSWNAGACCGTSRDNDNDDVQFFRNVVADIKSKLCVDPKRIYATGMSNGGFMSNYLACKASDLFAAVAPVSGMLGIANEQCTPGRPVPVCYVHGDADPVVPFNGGTWLLGPDLMSANDSTAGWVARNGCKDVAPDVTNKVGNTTCSTYHECDQDVEVTFCVVSGGGHCWPGMQGQCVWFNGLVQGGTIPNLKGSDEIWKFFEKYSL